MRKRFTAWNHNREAVGWKSWLWRSSLAVAVVWVVITYLHVCDAWSEDWPCAYRSLTTWWDAGTSKAAFVAYIWTAFIGGTFGVYAFVELDRNIFWSRPFQSYSGVAGSVAAPPELRLTPRIEPIVLGIFERLLFTTLAIPLLRGDGHVGALGAICAGYVALKAIKRVRATDKVTIVSIHSIWGSAINVGFGALGGWLFNYVSPVVGV